MCEAPGTFSPLVQLQWAAVPSSRNEAENALCQPYGLHTDVFALLRMVAVMERHATAVNKYIHVQLPFTMYPRPYMDSLYRCSIFFLSPKHAFVYLPCLCAPMKDFCRPRRPRESQFLDEEQKKVRMFESQSRAREGGRWRTKPKSSAFTFLLGYPGVCVEHKRQLILFTKRKRCRLARRTNGDETHNTQTNVYNTYVL